MLDEVNADMYHMSNKAVKDMNEIYKIGTLTKIDYEHSATNIGQFLFWLPNHEIPIDFENEYGINLDDIKLKLMNDPKFDKYKRDPNYIVSWSDSLNLKIVGARRIELQNMYKTKNECSIGNIKHLIPNQTKLKQNTSIDNNIVDTSDNELELRTSLNIAAELVRIMVANDPSNRRDMLHIWKNRHKTDIGFFCDFTANLTMSTPRELQNLLECINYNDRLKCLITLLKREEKMIKKRDEIINDVDAIVKRDEENKYLSMILTQTSSRLYNNFDQKKMKYHDTKHSNTGNTSEETTTQGKAKKLPRYERLANTFLNRVKDKILNDEVKEVFDEGIDKLLLTGKDVVPNSDLESTKQYLDWISSLPWNIKSKDNYDINKARDILDRDHYGMLNVKNKILEYIACNKLKGREYDDIIKDKNDKDSRILCFIGPPGVGKTSIGNSIANCLDKKFYKFSLGGIDDSHMLKGFLRTYSGSQPGKIVYALKHTGVNNPLILIDEIDKIGAKHNNPSHALLEILDPSQNDKFIDNYIECPIDISNVLFVCTANDESKIDPILRDRLNIIHLNGYDYIEKLNIAKQYLIPKLMIKSGLTENNIDLNDDIIKHLCTHYCRESGVRSLEKHIEMILNKVALKFAEDGVTYYDIHPELKPAKDTESDTDNDIQTQVIHTTKRNKLIVAYDEFKSVLKRAIKKEPTPSQIISEAESENNETTLDPNIGTPCIKITVDNIKEYVGPKKFESTRTYDDINSTPIGVVTGLAYSNYGGGVNYIETIKYRKHNKSKKSDTSGGGKIKTTGQIGNVMNESIEISYLLARSMLLNYIDENNNFFDEYDIHLHCPEGGIQKDGPSAGITITTALLSLALNYKISPDIAMTGEITLTGKILKIGGLREKMLAAKRHHIKTLIFPYDNYDEFYDDNIIPEYLRKEFKDVHFVKSYREVLQILFSQNIETESLQNIGELNQVRLN